MSNYRVRQVLTIRGLPERQLRFLLALATWMDDDSLIVKASVDLVFEQTGTARNTARTARRELEKSGRVSSMAGTGRGHLTVWTVHCLAEKGVNVADPLSPETKGVSDIDPLPAADSKGVSVLDLLPGGKGVNERTERGSIEPKKGGQPQSADLRERDQELNRIAQPFPHAPPRAVATPDVRAEEEEDHPSGQTPIGESGLIAQIRAIRPAWSTESIRRELAKPEVRERPWPLVCSAFVAVARDPATRHPGRLAFDGDWWDSRPATTRPGTPARFGQPPRCNVCKDRRRVEDPVTGDDAGPCPNCHPDPVRRAV